MQKITIGKIDNTAPTITNVIQNISSDKKQVNIQVEANDINTTLQKTGSGISGYQITNTNTEPSNYQASNTFTITQNGTYYLWAKDVVGNVSLAKTILVKDIEIDVEGNIIWNDSNNTYNSRTQATQNINIEYQMPKAKIQITKKDRITEENLPNAEFTLYEWNGTEYVEKEVITDTDGDGLYTSKEYEWNTITQGKYKLLETGVPKYHKNLNFGMEYAINKLKTQNYTITPDYSNTEYKITYFERIPDDFDRIDSRVENEPIKVKAKIEKIDEETQVQIKADTIFTIYEWDNTINQYKEYISYTTNKKVEVLRQEDGTYLTGEWLYYTKTNEGKYVILETVSPVGYFGDYKTNQRSLQKNIYDINVKEIVELGNYKGQEASNESTIILSNQGQTGQEKYITNKRVKAQVNLQLIDSQTQTNIAQANATLTNARYSIYAKEDIYHADGVTTNYEGQEGLLYKKDEIVQALKTDENGKIIFENLECGKYYIKQNEEIIPANTKIETAISNKEGKAIFQKDLPLGNYYIKQEKAAPGYKHNTQTGKWVEVAGQFRSYNTAGEDGRKHLDLFLFVTAIRIYEDKEELEETTNANLIYLDGYLCKPPVFRQTPLGRQITDLLIAVNRPYGKSDYIPCIAWGRVAQWASEFEIGNRVRLYGRVQSREYFKRNLPGSEAGVYKEAYEISVIRMQRVEDLRLEG